MMVDLNPAQTDFKGPTNFSIIQLEVEFCYCHLPTKEIKVQRQVEGTITFYLLKAEFRC